MPPTPAGTNLIKHEVRIAATPERVFAFFTDAAKLTQWLGVEPTLDPRPGGICRIVFRAHQPVADVFADAFGVEPARVHGTFEPVARS